MVIHIAELKRNYRDPLTSKGWKICSTNLYFHKGDYWPKNCPTLRSDHISNQLTKCWKYSLEEIQFFYHTRIDSPFPIFQPEPLRSSSQPHNRLLQRQEDLGFFKARRKLVWGKYLACKTCAHRLEGLIANLKHFWLEELDWRV